MNLNELNDLLQKVRVLETAVEEVKSRIINHRSDYDSNENATRYGLIDPILDALDWDVRDVGMVRTEYRMTSGPVDYALFDGTAPLAVVEAKRLSRTLDASVSVQLLSYAIDVESIQYVVATNGDTWQMRARGQRDTVFDVKLSSGNSVVSALELIRMWRGVLVGDQAISPIGALKDQQTPTQDEYSGAIQTDEPPLSTPRVSRGWIRLDEARYNARDPRPTRIRLPDQSEIRITSWKNVWISIAEWMVEREPQMTACSFGNTKPTVIKTTDEGFWGRGGYQLSNGLWIEPGVTGNTLLRTARSFLQHFNVEPSSVLIRFD